MTDRRGEKRSFNGIVADYPPKEAALLIQEGKNFDVTVERAIGEKPKISGFVPLRFSGSPKDLKKLRAHVDQEARKPSESQSA